MICRLELAILPPQLPECCDSRWASLENILVPLCLFVPVLPHLQSRDNLFRLGGVVVVVIVLVRAVKLACSDT